MTSRVVHGEQLEVPERVILAPAVGVFTPLSAEETAAVDGQIDGQVDGAKGDEVVAEDRCPEGAQVVTEGQVVGVVEARGQAHPVRSAFTGFLVGMLAHPGERVREGQPVAWLRIT